MEIRRNTWKYVEIRRNMGKYVEIKGEKLKSDFLIF